MNYELKWLRVAVPLALAAGILWWMYRGIRWEELEDALSHQMSWTWMLLSLPFGVSAQVLRAMRWKQTLAPLGERPRLSTCIHAVFLSYASSLIVPRVGEVLRCEVLRRYDGTNFSKGVGTVVTERIIDSLLILVLSLVVFLTQIPVFLDIFQRTGMSLGTLLGQFTLTGWLVTAACGLLALVGIVFLVKRFIIAPSKSPRGETCGSDTPPRGRRWGAALWDGLLSVREVEKPWLFLLYSVGIWVSYFLHFYLTFYCFDFTAGLGPMVALIAFIVGIFAVLVPTPNGAGSWHFATKTVLVLYGVGQTASALYVLIVHTLHTLFIALLGVWSSVALSFRK